jgi:cell pole-organizing protein PopZ
MTDAKSPEPSIEEILASIRKIISDDEPEAEAAHEANAPDDGVLELTNVVFDIPPAETAESEADEPFHHEPPPSTPIAPPPPPPQSEQPAPQPVSTTMVELEQAIEGIASDETLAAASGAFAKLSHTAPPHTEPQAPSSGGRSVEDIVRELLRPILRQWIDQNLAGIVERSVERELRKISRKAEDS